MNYDTKTGEIQMKKRNSKILKTSIFSILLVASILVEIFFIVNYPMEIMWIVIAGIIILVDIFLLISSIVKGTEVEQEKVNEEQGVQDEQDKLVEKLLEIDRSEKASYILMKKCFLDLDERLSNIEKLIVPISRDIDINQQKMEHAIIQSMEDNRKVAKVIIGRNKEHADTLMSFNDEFAEKLKFFEEKLEQIEGKVSAINTGSALLAGLSEELPEEMQEKESLVEEASETEGEIEDIEALLAGLTEELPQGENEVEEEILVGKEQLGDSDFSDSNKMISPEDFAALLSNIGGDETETIDNEEMSDIDIEPDFEIMEESEKPDFSDPNKVMSPEDIAALIAGM